MVNYAVLQPSEGISDFENLIYFGESLLGQLLTVKDYGIAAEKYPTQYFSSQNNIPH